MGNTQDKVKAVATAVAVASTYPVGTVVAGAIVIGGVLGVIATAVKYFEKPPAPPNVANNKKREEAINLVYHKFGIDVRNFYNFAFVGRLKAGKSTMINAVRGMENDSTTATNHGKGAARTNVNECTSVVSIFEFSDPRLERIRLCDIPGSAGKIFSREKYFVEAGLAAFDCLLILFQGDLSQDEMEIAREAQSCNLGVCFVRTKCDNDLQAMFEDKEIDAIDQKSADMFVRKST